MVAQWYDDGTMICDLRWGILGLNPALGKQQSCDHLIDIPSTLTLSDANLRYREALDSVAKLDKWKMQLPVFFVSTVLIKLSCVLYYKDLERLCFLSILSQAGLFYWPSGLTWWEFVLWLKSQTKLHFDWNTSQLWKPWQLHQNCVNLAKWWYSYSFQMEYKPHCSNCRVFSKPTKSFKTKFTLKALNELTCLQWPKSLLWNRWNQPLWPNKISRTVLANL